MAKDSDRTAQTGLAGVGIILFLIGFYLVPKPAGWWIVGFSFIFDIPLILGIVVASMGSNGEPPIGPTDSSGSK